MEKIITDLTCRVCLNVEELMVHIYEEVEDWSTDLSSLLEQCGDLKVDRADSYPKYLCKECTSELLIAAKFREKCSRSKEILQQYETQLLTLQENKYLSLEDKDLDDNTSKPFEVQQSCLELPPLDIKEERDIEANALLPPIDFYEPSLDENNVVITTDELQINPKQVFIKTTTTARTEPNLDHSFAQEDESFNDFADEIIVFDANELDDNSCNLNKNINETIESHDLNSCENNEQSVEEMQTNCSTANLKFLCDTCGAAFASAQNLKRHITASHVSLQIFRCPKCHYCFSLEVNFTEHCKACNVMGQVKTVTRIETQKDYCVIAKRRGRRKLPTPSDEEVTCMYCSKICKNAFALNMHIRTHTGERPFNCNQCSKTFKTRSTLSTHLKRHAGVPDYKCSYCSKTFYETTNLQAHIRTHTGEKPHRCTVCGKRFTRVFLLQLHMRTHTGEKPYPCPHCTRSFAQLCDMKNHIRTHTGERQFQCSLCPKSFIKRRPLIVHMQRHAALEDVSNTSSLSEPNDQHNALAEDCIIEVSEECSLGMEFNFNDLILEDQL